MSERPGFWRRLGLPFRQRRFQVDVDDEIAFHLEMKTARLMREGMSAEQAGREARRRFGDEREISAQLLAEGRREAVRMAWAEGLGDTGRDVRHAVRSLAKTPALTGMALVILSLGIGATLTFFAAVHAVLLRPMPFADPDRVAQVELVEGAGAAPSTLVSPGALSSWQDGVEGVETVAAVLPVTAALSTGDLPTRVQGMVVSVEFWSVVGARPAWGRIFLPEEDRPGAEPVIVLAHQLWTRAFGADPGVLGRQVLLDAVPTTVIGVMPRELSSLGDPVDFWRPLRLDPDQRANVGSRYLGGLALVEAGATNGQAAAGLEQTLTGLGARGSDGQPYGVRLTPVEVLQARPYRGVLLVLLSAGILVLVIGCGNVATLLLARGASRERELAIRSALGAGRGRIVRGLLTESVILGLSAGGMGLLLGRWGVTLLQQVAPAGVPRLDEAGVTPTVLLAGFGLAMATTLMFGLAPALNGGRVVVQRALTQGEGATRGGTGRRERLRSGFLAVQAALSLSLLVGAGLLIRTAAELASMPNGYRAEGVLTGVMALPFSTYPDLPSVLSRYDEVLREVRSLAGVEQAAIGSRVPLAGAGAGYDFRLDGAGGSELVQTRLRIVGPGYFATLGIPLAAGREFDATDRASAPRRVLVNQTLAGALGLDGQDAVGRRVYAPGDGPFADAEGSALRWEIVGVVADAREMGPRNDPRPELFFALEQAPEAPWNWLGRQMVVALRASGDPAALAVPLQRTVQALDPSLPVYDIRTLPDRLQGALARERFAALVLSGLGAIGLLLAAAGIFGAVAHRIGGRTREIGVRMALGAESVSVLGLVMRQALTPVILGLVLGVPLALALSVGLRGVLFGVGPGDPGVMVVAGVVLVVVAAAAALVPAQRAAAVDPIQALRAD